MKTTLMLGGELDIATADEVREVGDEVSSRVLDGLSKRPLPIRRRVPTNVVATAGQANVLLDFGTPAMGRMWNVMEIVVLGVDDHTAVAGTIGGAAIAVPYIGSLPLGTPLTVAGTAPPLGDAVRNSITIPGVFLFTKEAQWVHQGENLFVYVQGMNAFPQPLTGVATVNEWIDKYVEAGRM